jgi:hypothetical protein
MFRGFFCIATDQLCLVKMYGSIMVVFLAVQIDAIKYIPHKSVNISRVIDIILETLTKQGI